MPLGDKSGYTDKQKRKARHIEESSEDKGVSKDEWEGRAWAPVNKQDGSGKKSDSAKKASSHKKSSGKKSPGKSAGKQSSPSSRSSNKHSPYKKTSPKSLRPFAQRADGAIRMLPAGFLNGIRSDRDDSGGHLDVPRDVGVGRILDWRFSGRCHFADSEQRNGMVVRT